MQRSHLVKRLRRSAGALRQAVCGPFSARRAERRLARPGSRRRHNLPGELIVSLTSHPARFSTLRLTLACLLDQTIRPDRTILWIADREVDTLPPEVRLLEERGLEIRGCDDLRSFKKLVPALQAFPDAFIVTADDDLYYRPAWLEQLVAGLAPDGGVIPCHRAHRIKRKGDGSLAAYGEWTAKVLDERARAPSIDILPTTGAGALFPPHSLDARATDRTLFQQLAPDSDDLWFYWCARLAGTTARKVGGRSVLITWPGTQQSSLWDSNEAGGNDRAIAALEKHFGYLDFGSG
jgi:hypothetical protein